jgi:pSer/pThr/pTyr-binding forkhead associated (FHA) protein
MNPRIVILSGARAGAVVPLSADKFVIGRDETADLSIADPSLSRRHCVC